MFQSIHVPKIQAPFVPISQFGKFDLEKTLVSKEKVKKQKKKPGLSEKCKTWISLF
jgi:hypothetical protein